MDDVQLKEILDQHIRWLTSTEGERANLSGANLSRANLYGVDLYGADLYGVDLTDAKFDVNIKKGIFFVSFGPYMFLKGSTHAKIGCHIKTIRAWKKITEEKAWELGLSREYYKAYKYFLDAPIVKWW